MSNIMREAKNSFQNLKFYLFFFVHESRNKTVRLKTGLLSLESLSTQKYPCLSNWKCSIGFAFFNSLAAFIVLFALYGVVYAIVDGNQRAFVSDLSTEKLRATALGTFHTATGLVALPASLIAGFLWQITPTITFIYGSILSMASVLLFLIFKNHLKDWKINIYFIFSEFQQNKAW